MAGSILIPLKAVFDDKGIKDAQKQFNKLGGSLKSVVGALGLSVGIGALVNTLKDASKAAVEDAKSQALLANQLVNSVGATDQQISAVEASISAMQLQASVADDVIRPAFAQLARATGDVAKATELTQIALDVSAGTGRDLGAVAIALSRAYAGNTTALSRLGIKAKDGVNIFDQLKQQFDGAAEAAANTDPFQRLNIIFGEIQEQIGMALLPELNNLANYFASPAGQKELQGYASLVKELAQVFIFVGTTVAEFLAGFKVVGAAFGKLFKGDFAGFIELMNSRGMVDALAKLDGLSTTANKTDTKAFAPLSSGLVAATKTAKTAAKTVAKSTKTIIDEQKKLTDEFIDDINSLTMAFKDLGRSSKELGQFEQQAVDAFDAIAESLEKGLANKALTQNAARYISEYIRVEKVALTALARQRDVILNKIAIAQQISGSFIDAANITGLLTNETRQVTKSVTSLVDGIATTVKTTFDEVVTGNLADSFKKIVDKTKNFAKNLVALKKLGLNGTLFKQIVDAGAEAGGATAEAIIAGGVDTVSELNGLFDELNQAGSDIAKTSTDTFYDLGEGVSNAFIDGLKSQEAALAEQIASMVATIEEAFATMLANLDKLKAGQMTVKASSLDTFEYARILAGTGNPLSAEDVRFAQIGQRAGATVNVTVNAGLGTNGKQVGQQITSLLNQYAKANA